MPQTISKFKNVHKVFFQLSCFLAHPAHCWPVKFASWTFLKNENEIGAETLLSWEETINPISSQIEDKQKTRFHYFLRNSPFFLYQFSPLLSIYNDIQFPTILWAIFAKERKKFLLSLHYNFSQNIALCAIIRPKLHKIQTFKKLCINFQLSISIFSCHSIECFCN